MSLLTGFPRLCFAMVLLAITGFCVAEAAWELLVVAVAAAGLSWSITEGPRGRTLPPWAVNALVLVAAGVTVVDLVRHGHEIASVLGRFCLWLILIKLYDRRSARDHGQLMSLSLLLVLVGCAHQPPPLAFGAVLLVYAVTGLYTLLLYQLYAAHERLLADAAEGPAADWVRRRPIMGRRGRAHLRWLAVALGTAGILLSIVVFLAFPRHIGRGFSLTGDQQQALRRSGFSAEVNLVGGSRITPSLVEVGTVRVAGADGRPSRDGGPFYLRGAALDRYREGSWSSSSTSQIQLDVPAGTITPLASGLEDAIRAAPRLVEVRLRRPSEVVFAPSGTLAIESGTSRRVLVDPADLTVRVPRTSAMLRRYDLWVDPTPDADVRRALYRGRPTPSRIVGEFDRGDPEHPDAPLVRGYANEILRRAGVPERGAGDNWNRRVADALAAELRSPPFAYTLDMSDLRRTSRDPVTDFLLEHRRGHCEFFASALALMCQSLDVPARVVAGYVLRERDPATGRFIVRAADAHAWVEVRTGPYRWERIDPTPSGAVVSRQRPDATIASAFGELLRQAEGTWSDRFVGFDQRSQSVLLERIDRGGIEYVRSVGRRIAEAAAQLNRFFRLGVAGYVWLGGVTLIALVAGAVLLRILLRRRRIRRELGLGRRRGPGATVAGPRPRDVEFYFDMLEALRRAGVPKPVAATPLQHADALATRRPEAAGLVRELATRYYELRFGARAIEAGEHERRRGDVVELQRRLGRRA